MTHGLYSPWNSPGQNTGVGSLSLLQGIFLNQGLNPGLPHCRKILYPAEPQGKSKNTGVGSLSLFQRILLTNWGLLHCRWILYQLSYQGSLLKSRDITLLTKFHLVKAMAFPVVMYGYQIWTIKKAEHQRIDAFELWFCRRLLRVPWNARRSNQSILKELSESYSVVSDSL